MNVLTMPLHLGHSDIPLATTLPPAGFVITLTHPCVSMAVITSARFWKDSVILVMAVLTMPLHSGALGFTSSHNVATRWIQHNFNTTACFDGCHSITEIRERLQHIRTDATSLPQNWSCIVFTIGFIVSLVHLTCIFMSSVILFSAFFFAHGFFVLQNK